MLDYAEEFNFVGMVADGSLSGCASYLWNVDLPSAGVVDEVSVIHDIVSAVSAEDGIASSSSPKLAIGYSLPLSSASMKARLCALWVSQVSAL